MSIAHLERKREKENGWLLKEQISMLRKAYEDLDEDHNGYISIKDLGTFLRSRGENPTEAELQELINEVGIEQDGTIEFFEFVELVTRERKKENDSEEEELKKTFKALDKEDQNGYISVDEIRKFMTEIGGKLTDEDLDEMFREADSDGDGQVHYEEFLLLMLPK